jgi:hypothetical protein
MADKMDVDAVNGEREEETVGPAPTHLPPERSTYLRHHIGVMRKEQLLTIPMRSHHQQLYSPPASC